MSDSGKKNGAAPTIGRGKNNESSWPSVGSLFVRSNRPVRAVSGLDVRSGPHCAYYCSACRPRACGPLWAVLCTFASSCMSTCVVHPFAGVRVIGGASFSFFIRRANARPAFFLFFFFFFFPSPIAALSRFLFPGFLAGRRTCARCATPPPVVGAGRHLLNAVRARKKKQRAPLVLISVCPCALTENFQFENAFLFKERAPALLIRFPIRLSRTRLPNETRYIFLFSDLQSDKKWHASGLMRE